MNLIKFSTGLKNAYFLIGLIAALGIIGYIIQIEFYYDYVIGEVIYKDSNEVKVTYIKDGKRYKIASGRLNCLEYVIGASVYVRVSKLNNNISSIDCVKKGDFPQK